MHQCLRRRQRPGPPVKILPGDLSEREYINAFLTFGEFGKDGLAEAIKRQGWGVFTDVAGARLVISDAFFWAAGGKSKIRDKRRRRYMLLFAAAIQDPDEIIETWVTVGGKRASAHRNYVARFVIEGESGRNIPALAVFDLGRDETGRQEWRGVTAFDPENDDFVVARAQKRKQQWRRVYVK